MGDVILTSSVVRTVHNQLNCEIHYLIKDSFRDLVKHSPFVHSVHTLSESLESTISKLEKEINLEVSLFDIPFIFQRVKLSNLMNHYHHT